MLALAALATPLRAARAQDAAIVEALAPVLAAEDARSFDAGVLERALGSPDSLVAITAAMAIGRIGDAAGTPLLLRIMDQGDSVVRPYAAFALGVLRDSAAAGALIRRLGTPPALDTASAVEAITALGKIGGAPVATFFTAVLRGSAPLPYADPTPIVRQVLLESWRLGDLAPADAILPFMSDTSPDTRWPAVYTLGRVRAKVAASRMLDVLRDENVFIRSLAARALGKGYADLAGLPAQSVASALAPLVDDVDAGVRVNAIRSLESFRLPAFAGRVVPRLDDPQPNVGVQAAEALGYLGGPEAVAALQRVLGQRRSFALRREAVLGLARADTAAFFKAAEPWTTSRDWRERAVAAEGSALATGGGARLDGALRDSDGRVAGAALQAWAGAAQGPDSGLIRAARPLLGNSDAVVRAAAADALSRAHDVADVPALAAMYGRTGRDSIPDAAQSALVALAAIAKASPAGKTAVETGFLARAPRPADYLLRRWAEDNWPEAARRWGSAYPIATGRTLQDYRDIVRRYMLPGSTDHAPKVLIDVDQAGTVELELFGPDAPLTVANFLQLADRHFFDGNRWHRVVPNFVVQDGDPRGDGNGGPGGAIRDELNRHRYVASVIGMALSGPDTGSSQWFINLSPQPHLDGTYTVFGKVVGGSASLGRIVQGDLIRTIRRE
jgi:cyclophilin family peptidyl-prolyl cis-trans isomerase/HEAT repeat protein